MAIDRRRLVRNLSLASLGAAWSGPLRAFGALNGSLSTLSAGVDAGLNRLITFNNLRHQEAGETDEFTTLREIRQQLGAVDPATRLIFLGLRSGTAESPTGMPGELAQTVTAGTIESLQVTRPDGHGFTPLGLDDPIVAAPVLAVHDDTAHSLDLDDPSLMGSVLWSFYDDETVRKVAGFEIGLHNAFTNVDQGMTNALYQATCEARSNGSLAESWRRKLRRFFPVLADDAAWANFAATLGKSILEILWMDYIRRQGWDGAAVVLTAPLASAAAFHVTEWNRTSPSEPDFKVGGGDHLGLLHVRYGQEFRPYADPTASTWQLGGVIIDDAKLPSTTPAWRAAIDVFGHSFHIHGQRMDGAGGGHVLMAMLATGKVQAKLYPLSLADGSGVSYVKNDLALDPQLVERTAGGLTVTVRNLGGNYARNVAVELKGDDGCQERCVIPLLGPLASAPVRFGSELAKSHASRRRVTLDPDGRFIEGGAGTANNVIVLQPD